ncbi:S8 family serine peptidase [Luteimonas composti]|uniref:S8 family serine peptidase n=1 Tax=Luteimonas composti TaxID=398257 RepID=A0ABT6MML6_9GAMM|nr:autotransporter serine protease [Luteimonas composti]MDH7451832.1 S8 family serine peptidase [Luteimonas composti]
MQQSVRKKHSLLAVAVTAACALSACGGGGGNTRADPPPVSPPPTAPPPAPPTVQDPDPAYSLHLAWTGADEAHAHGLTGAGTRIGIVDSGVNRNHPAMRDGRVVASFTYIDPRTNNLQVDDVVGHGTAVAQTAAGKPFGRWPGGIAPGAEIVSARIISDKPPEDDGSGRGNEVDGALGLGPIHADLIRQGVRVMNNSWGGLYWTNPAATAEIAAEYRPFIRDNGGLVVFSAGNSGFDDPSDTAALPSQPGTGGSLPAADLERGWLTVAALDSADPTQLAYYSNACGLAMRYCLAAPGTVVVTGTNDAPSAPTYARWTGTSFAAPIVSGAAALVWEAFPYFDNDLVRQTLLGTATDLGAAGVDEVFGYGAVDIAAAVQGPGRFDWGDVVAGFDTVTSTWGNAIDGDGGLVKRGSGRLVLGHAGTIGYRGDTRVEAGVLQVDGQLTRSHVQVGRQGTLTGAGTIGQSIRNAGTVAIDADNRLVAGGDYVQTGTGTLSVQVGTALLVEGAATLEGGTLHVSGIAPGYVTRASEPVLTAIEGLSGEFDQLTQASSLFLDAELAYDYDQSIVSLEIERLDVASAARRLAGVSKAGLAAAERLERAFGLLDAQPAAAEASLLQVAGAFQALSDEASAAAALDSLSGESHSLATSLGFDAIDMGRRALSTRLGQLHDGEALAGSWRQALGQGGSTGIASGGYRLDGWAMGQDQRSGQLVSGFSFGEMRSHDWLGGNRDRSRDRQTHAGVYLGRMSHAGYAAASLSTGRFDRGIERRLFAGDAARAGVFAAYSGGYTSFDVEAGRHQRLGDWQLTSYLGASHVGMRQDGFAEWGSGFALQAKAADLSRTQAIAGLRAGRDWHGLRLSAWSEWQQTLRADGFDVQAGFTGIDAWAPLPLADAAKSGGLVGFGLEAWLGRNARLMLDVDQRFGPRGSERVGSLRYVLGF